MTAHRRVPVRRGLSKIEVAVLLGIVALVVGIVVVAVQKSQVAAAKTWSTNNLKVQALSFEAFQVVFGRLPSNGVGGSAGLVSPEKFADAPFHYQILPYVESSHLYTHPEQATPTTPIRVVYYLEAGRRRIEFIAGRPLTDYAVNLCALYGVGVVPTADNTKATLTLKDVTDGPANTILLGGKTLHPADYDTTDPAVDDSFLNTAAGGTNRATARYTVGATTPAAGPLPAEVTHPRAVRDADATPGVAADTFGGPYPDGTLFAFCDGHVAFLRPAWLAPDQTAGTGSAASVFRAALTPQGGEAFDFE